MPRIVKRTVLNKKNEIEEMEKKLDTHDEKLNSLSIEQEKINNTLTYFLMMNSLLNMEGE